MTTDGPGLALTRRTLDHRATVKVLTDVLSVGSGEGPYEPPAEELAAALARAGYALVQIDPAPAAYPGGFFSRTEDK